MGNDISAANSIAYYQKEICGDVEDGEDDSIPIFKINKIRLMENHDVEENSIVFLYAADVDKNGYLTKGDIEDFIRSLQGAGLDPNDCDFGFKSGAFFTESLCKSLMNTDREALRDWAMVGIAASFPVSVSDGIKFISDEAMERLYEVLQIQQLLGRGFQWVLDMLQRHAEANLKMNLDDPEFDNLVPIDTVLSFIQKIADGMVESYTAMTKQ